MRIDENSVRRIIVELGLQGGKLGLGRIGVNFDTEGILRTPSTGVATVDADKALLVQGPCIETSSSQVSKFIMSKGFLGLIDTRAGKSLSCR